MQEIRERSQNNWSSSFAFKGGFMTNEASEARRAYKKAWAAAHPEKTREYLKRWRHNNPDKVRAANARYWEKRAQRGKGNK